ncbi:hypothetical protein B0H16DRAFT_1327613 [Mycena metata]|uniref:Kinesin light chain n=1 Tax=Mycena metata TaxID=1033252 RepID=A0AAD7MWZ3_9AGAR|nr:hypothetical protein B0H16DRAFT_1327613 [Mycena metata]
MLISITVLYSFTDTFFLDASTVDTIDNGFKDIAVLRNVGKSSNDALTWLVSRREGWLLFFDNADDPNLNLNKFLPKCGHGNIIITSRNPELRIYGSNSQVSDMEQNEAITLLLKSAAQEVSPMNEKLAAEIVKALSYLPLAIVQAGAFIAKFGSLNNYLALYSKNRDRLLKERPAQTHDDYALTVYTTWQISFERLSSRSAQAAGYDFPPFGPLKEELQQPHNFLAQFLTPDGEWDTFAFTEVTNEIKSYSLMDLDPEANVFSIHPLVHSWCRTTLSNNDLQSSYCNVYSIVGMSVEPVPMADRQLACLKLLPHVESVMQFKKQHLVPDFRTQYAMIYHYAGRFKDAKELEVCILEKHSQNLGVDHLNTLYAMQWLAKTYKELDELDKAEELEVLVVEKRKSLLGEDHPDTLDATYHLAVTYAEHEQLEKAEMLQVPLLNKQRPIFGEDHLSTLWSMYNLAVIYQKLGQFQKAEELEVVVVNKRRAILGEDHPDTLRIMFNLAVTYQHLGDFDKAAQLQVVVVEKRKSILGEDHQLTLKAMYSLAQTYGKLGQFQEAEKLESVVVRKRGAILGDEHYDTLHVMEDLALTYRALREFEKAKELQIIAVDKRQMTLGSDHLYTLEALHNLACTYHDLGQWGEAEYLQIEVLEKQRAILGSGHPDTVRAVRNLALTYRCLGKLDKAEQLEKSI